MKEDDIVHFLKTRFPAPVGFMGIGDDCAVFPDESGGYWLVTTDSMVEGTHFLENKISARDLGYKLAMVNFSDIAAMGGRPHSAYLSCAMASDYVDAENLFDGVKEALEEVGIPLLGGDIAGSTKNLFLSMTVMGRAEKIVRRSGGRPGDILCVTDVLGDSAGGLQQLLNEDGDSLRAKHTRPRSHLKEGQVLAACRGVNAMMDVSDGLHIDVQRLAQASGCGAKIFLDKLPLSEELRAYAGDAAEELAISGGEDYCLLAAVDPGQLQELKDVRLYPVGELTKEPGALVYMRGKRLESISPQPFEHF